MPNDNLPKKGFIVQKAQTCSKLHFPVAASYSGQPGDDVYLDSAGRCTNTASGYGHGIQNGFPRDISKGEWYRVATDNSETCAAGDKIELFWEPWITFSVQIATGALADTYTTRTSAASYDAAGSQGSRYIDNSASTNDSFKIIHFWYEKDTGDESAVGAYQKVLAMWNQDKHRLTSPS